MTTSAHSASTMTPTQNLFQNLVWPAAAGNVAWAFFSVAIDDTRGHQHLARLTVLLVLAVYLAADWYTTSQEIGRMKRYYWIADAFLAAAIIVFALSVQYDKPWVGSALRVLFAVAIVGHLSGAWEPIGVISKRFVKRVILASINVIGIIATYVGASIERAGLWHLSFAILVVVLIWLLIRSRIYSQSPEQRGVGA